MMNANHIERPVTVCTCPGCNASRRKARDEADALGFAHARRIVALATVAYPDAMRLGPDLDLLAMLDATGKVSTALDAFEGR